MSKQNFDQKALNWDADPTRLERAKTVADAIRSKMSLSQSLAALEYGCGTGLLSFALQPYLGNITLADSSLGMLDVLRQKIEASSIKNMLPLRLDLTMDALPNETWDLVYSLMVLHHIPDTDQILDCFYKILNPSGYLCICDLDEEDGSFHGADVDDVHHGFNRLKLKKQVLQAGFRSVQFSTVFQMQKTDGDNQQKAYPLFLMIAQK